MTPKLRNDLITLSFLMTKATMKNFQIYQPQPKQH